MRISYRLRKRLTAIYQSGVWHQPAFRYNAVSPLLPDAIGRGVRSKVIKCSKYRDMYVNPWRQPLGKFTSDVGFGGTWKAAWLCLWLFWPLRVRKMR